MKDQIHSRLVLVAISLYGLIPLAAIAAVPAQSENTPVRSAIIVAQQRTIYVNPQTGNNSNSGQSEGNALQTISSALQKASSGTTIVLAAGNYSESVALEVKEGVTLKGNESQKGQGVTISGGGEYLSRTWGGQNVVIVAGPNSQILGVTVSNPNERGTGIWVEEGNPIIRNNTLTNNQREGVFITGTAAPKIENNIFSNNRADGISVTGSAKGEIRGNDFQNTGYALAIGGKSSPVVDNNQVRNNRIGAVITQQARPKFQGNTFENNTDNDIVSLAQASPELQSNNRLQKEHFIVTASQTKNSPSNSPKAVTPYFSCVKSEGNSYATVAARANSPKPETLVNWSKTIRVSPERTITPQQRCELVTNRLNERISSDGIDSWENLYFTNGSIGGNPVICLVQGTNSGCNKNNMLFSLTGENAKNPETVKQTLNAFGTGVASGSAVQETEGQTYVDVLKVVEKNLQPDNALWFVNGNGQ